MKQIRDGLHGNFLSLDRAVRAVASRVKISDEEVDGRRGLNRSSEDGFKTQLDRTVIRNVLCQARAAGILFRLLNQPSSSLPNWQDSAIGGFPIFDNGVSREGLEILARWAQSGAGFRLQGGSWAGQGSQGSRMDTLPAPSRLVQIGFDIDDLIRFLNANGIEHNLGEPLNGSSAHPAAASGQGLTILREPSVANVSGHANSQVAARGPTEAEVVDSSRPTQGGFSRPLPRFEFRGPLSEVLHLAVKTAADPYRYQSAYAALRELARVSKPPIPLLGYNESDDEVLWNNGDPTCPATFTVENMKSRYRSMKTDVV